MIFLSKYLLVSYFIITFVTKKSTFQYFKKSIKQEINISIKQQTMKSINLSMTVNGSPFSQPVDSFMAAMQRVTTTANHGNLVSNVTIKAWRA